ncbi:B2 protein [Dendrobium catenatum]|uniref:B2 protein n=1 Tax=Dendrobium catenatum TaxID=906689 RepID=A0A2I0XAJ1_9ASPA|nr:B2 protein [Dendrobium catenatum]
MPSFFHFASRGRVRGEKGELVFSFFILQHFSLPNQIEGLGKLFCKMDSLWQLGDEFRGQSKVSEDHQWSVITSKLAEMTRSKGERINNFDYPRNIVETKPWEKLGFQEEGSFDNLSLGLMNMDMKMNEAATKSSFRNNVYNLNSMYQKNNVNNVNNFKMNAGINKYANSITIKDANHNSNGINVNNNNNNINGNNSSNNNNVVDKRFKTLPSTEMLPRNEILGGYIFVCNNDTMQEDLKRQLFDRELVHDHFLVNVNYYGHKTECLLVENTVYLIV